MDKPIFEQYLPQTIEEQFSFYQKTSKDGNIHLIDNICGSGKTTFIIEQIKTYLSKNPNQKFIIVVTLISEIERFQNELSNYNFKAPNKKSYKDSKEYSFLRLIKNNENIVTTHRLMKQYKPDLYSYMKNYVLIIDEELQTVMPVFIKKNQIDRLTDGNELTIDKDRKINFILPNGYSKDKNDETEEVNNIINYIKRGTLYGKLENNKIIDLTWHLDPQFIIIPKMSILISYRFQNSLFDAWSKMHNIKYNILNIDILQQRENEILQNIKNNINIIEDISFITKSIREKNVIKQLREYLKTKYALATSHFDSSKKCKPAFRKTLMNICYNYFSKNNIDKKNDLFITCLKDLFEYGTIKNGKYKKQIGLKPKGCIQSKFVASTTRATNDYSDIHWILYLRNIFLNPFLNIHFKTNNCEIDENEYALSELIQLLFRSALRKNEKINIIIPSKRMRNLLQNWIKSQ